MSAALLVKFYDPLGFLAPVLIHLKVLFQKLCENKVKMRHYIVPENFLQKLKTLVYVCDLHGGHPIYIPRNL